MGTIGVRGYARDVPRHERRVTTQETCHDTSLYGARLCYAYAALRAYAYGIRRDIFLHAPKTKKSKLNSLLPSRKPREKHYQKRV